MRDYTNGAPRSLLDFLGYMRTIKGKSENTVRAYFYDLRLFMRFIALRFDLAASKTSGAEPAGSTQKIDEVDYSDVDETVLGRVTLSDLYAFMTWVSSKRGNESLARARKVATLKSFFGYHFTKAKTIDKNPAAELETPKTVKRLPRYLGLDESRALLFAASEEATGNAGWLRERNFAMTTLFLNCGMRLSELVGIDISSIRNDTITIIGKGDKERAVYLNQACVSALEAYKNVRPRFAQTPRDSRSSQKTQGSQNSQKTPGKTADALFLSSRGVRISKNMVQRVIKKQLALAGLDTAKYSTHKLRHTAATLMYQHGHVDIRALQAILGHASIATTQIYTHLDSRQLKAAVDSNPLSSFFSTNETAARLQTSVKEEPAVKPATAAPPSGHDAGRHK